MTDHRRRFNDADKAVLLRLRDDVHMGWAEIARAMGRPSAAGVASRYQRLKRLQIEEQARAARFARGKTRPCMTCRTPFHSPHNGVRMCDPCRSNPDHCSPSEACDPEDSERNEKIVFAQDTVDLFRGDFI